MLEALVDGLAQVLTWRSMGYLSLGVVIGIWLGAIPGLGGIIGLVLLLPFTFTMEPVPAFALLLGMFAVTTTSDTIASVMLGIPGTAASQATVLDGYPLAKQGQAARAFGAAFTVSAFGGVFGAVVLALSLPLVLPIILAFGSPELFMLGVLGLTMVGSLSGASLTKGLGVALLGLLLSTVGYAEAEAIPRYWFGSDYLIDRLPLIPVVLGLFAVPEVMELATRNLSISRVPKEKVAQGGLLDGVRDALRHWWLATRCAAIGTYVGMLPGMGGAIVDWIAYGHAVQSAKDKSRFGRGDIRGVIAPEAANNATKGGSLVPTVAFGIPGSLGASILLGALLVQGLKPGPEMLTTKLDLTFGMVWMIVLANVLAAALLMVLSRQIARIAFVPGHLVVPAVVLFVFMGAWLGGASLGDWVTCILFGAIGYAMKQGGWPRPPLILAFILGSLMENSLTITQRIYDGFDWLLRPAVLVILALAAITVILSALGFARRRSPSAGAEPDAGEGRGGNPGFSIALGVLLVGGFAFAAWHALGWPNPVGRFPFAIGVAGAALAVLAVSLDAAGIARAPEPAATRLRHRLADAAPRRSLAFLGYLVAMMLAMLAIGQKLAIPLFIFVYLIRWGDYPVRIALPYALAGWLVLVAFYDRTMNLLWHPSWLSGWLPDILPDWLPGWLFV